MSVREAGMNVEYNGKYYAVLSEFGPKQYPVGELICELNRLHPTELKEIILNNSLYGNDLTPESSVDAIFELRKQLHEKYPLVITEMVSAAFVNLSIEYFTQDDNRKKEWMATTDGTAEEIKSFILQDTGFDSFGVKTVGQFLLTCYALFSNEFCVVGIAFLSFARSEENDEDLERATKMLEMYQDPDRFQDIGFRIMGYDGRFNSVYCIRSMISLLMFEIAHMIDNGCRAIKCKNCGQYFVPLKRSDTRYCNYPSPEDPKRTCKEVGAQNAWARKEKTDDVTRVYRKVYMRYKMAANRHPERTEAQKKLEQLIAERGEWMRRIQNEEAKPEEFIAWLDSFSKEQ